MTRIRCVLLACILMVGCGDNAETASTNKTDTTGEPAPVTNGSPRPGLDASRRLAPGSVATPTTILVLGDSISAAYGIQRDQGWVALLDTEVKRLGGEHRVVNASISGETTGGGLARLQRALEEQRPDLVIVELGGNDGLRGYPVERIEQNLRRIIEQCQEAGAAVILVGMQIPPNYGPRYAQGFAGLFATLASDYQVPLVDAFLEEIALAGNLMQSDGIHPTAAAQPILLRAIWDPVAEFLQRR